MTFRKELNAAYRLRSITGARQKKAIRNALYRLYPDDWDKNNLPSLAVAFAVLAAEKYPKDYPGWIASYQMNACALSDRIDAYLKEQKP